MAGKLFQCLGAAGLVSGGWLVGREVERRRGHDVVQEAGEQGECSSRVKEVVRCRPPGLPLVASVSAAVAIQPSNALAIREEVCLFVCQRSKA